MGKEAPNSSEVMQKYLESAKTNPEEHLKRLLAQAASYVARTTPEVTQRSVAWEKTGKNPDNDPFIKSHKDALRALNLMVKDLAGIELSEFKLYYERDLEDNKKIPANDPDRGKKEWPRLRWLSERILETKFSEQAKTLANKIYMKTMLPNREIPRPVLKGQPPAKYYLFKKLPGETGDTRLTIHPDGTCECVVDGSKRISILPPFPDTIWNFNLE